MTHSVTLWLGCSLMALASFSWAADCTYRSSGSRDVQYRCDDGRRGRLHTHVLGNVKDSGTGITWRQDALGTLRGSDGRRYRQDALGNIKSNTGERWRTDSLGRYKSSTGTVCRKDSLGRLKCRKDEGVPPPLLYELSR